MRVVQRFNHREFPELYKWQVLSFMKVEWPFIFSSPYQFSEDTYPPEQFPIHFIIAEGKAVISHAETISMKLEHAGDEYVLCGMGNVFTFPPYRGKGYGRKVVNAATNHILRRGADVAILFCDPKLEAFYEKAGWEGLSTASTQIGKPGNSQEVDGLRMMMFLSDKGRDGYASFVDQPLFIDDPW